ncbi:hypothetical protein SCUCBS95973_002639 [Sporothrix curviconia]|uniref:Uncharacterized protein n=1 Tax=Sporothrix curviconia TaxID=1260050 RepID=A0ABP0B8V7_9PEZI
MFGIARRPGHVYFDPARDVLYFGPRDGFMAAEAQLRTMLALADPDELAQVQRVALSATVLGDGFPSPPQSSLSASTNLAADVLHLLRAKLPHLRELIVVPHDENAVFRADAARFVPLPLPPTALPLAPVSSWPSLPTDQPTACSANGSLARHVHAAMRRVCAAVPDWKPPRWRILAVSNGPPEHSQSEDMPDGESEGEGESQSENESESEGELDNDKGQDDTQDDDDTVDSSEEDAYEGEEEQKYREIKSSC